MQTLVASLPVHNTNNRNSSYSSGASQGFGKSSAAPLCLHLGRPWQPAFGQQVRKKTAFDIQRRVSGNRQDWVCALQALERVEANRESWLLEPIGDGTTEHLINKAVSLPSAFHLGIDTATVGRLAGRADIVIPIATVSGVHARLEKKDGNLFVTDLNSTNGTYVDNKRIKPQTVTPVSPGSRITFGDQHLATFRFSKSELGHA